VTVGCDEKSRVYCAGTGCIGRGSKDCAFHSSPLRPRPSTRQGFDHGNAREFQPRSAAQASGHVGVPVAGFGVPRALTRQMQQRLLRLACSPWWRGPTRLLYWTDTDAFVIVFLSL
jgi:hypothetical protein